VSDISIRYSCWDGRLCGIAELLFCESCRRILSRHPQDVVDEIDSYYCQQSLDNLPSSEAMTYLNRSTRFFECSRCCNVLSIRATSGAAVSKYFENGTPNVEDNTVLYYFCCGHCRWDSLSCGLFGHSPEDLIKVGHEKETNARESESRLVSQLVSHFQGMDKVGIPEDVDVDEKMNKLWRWQDAEDEYTKVSSIHTSPMVLETSNDIQETFHQLEQENCESQTGIEKALVLPDRLSLRTKRSIRCRQCMASGLPNILVKPQINPLKGDSSMRTNIGAWFKKKSLAYDYLPRIVAHYHPSDDKILQLVVTNPRDTTAVIKLDETEPVRIDPYDEVDELDMLNASTPPKPLPPSEADPESIQGRLFNKVYLNHLLDEPVNQCQQVCLKVHFSVEDEDPIEFELHMKF